MIFFFTGTSDYFEIGLVCLLNWFLAGFLGDSLKMLRFLIFVEGKYKSVIYRYLSIKENTVLRNYRNILIKKQVRQNLYQFL